MTSIKLPFHYNIQVACWWQCLELVWLVISSIPFHALAVCMHFSLVFIDDDDFGVNIFSGNNCFFLFLKAFLTLSQIWSINIFNFNELTIRLINIPHVQCRLLSLLRNKPLNCFAMDIIIENWVRPTRDKTCNGRA